MARSQESGCRALRVEKGLRAAQERAGGLLRAASGGMHGARACDLTAVAPSAARPLPPFVLRHRDETQVRNYVSRFISRKISLRRIPIQRS